MRKANALFGIFCIGLAGAAWPADVTVAKDGSGSATTIQAGADAAGATGTVTILDSETYVEDVTLRHPDHTDITIQAAGGQQPTIEAANTRLDATYAALGLSAPDRFGFSVQTSCTLIGLNITNTDPQTNNNPTSGGPAACSLAIHASGVTVQDCTITGPPPGSSFGEGDWTNCLVMALGLAPASATLENCEISGGEHALANRTSGALAVSYVTATYCRIHEADLSCFQQDTGYSTFTDCVISDSAGNGISIWGGGMTLVGCNIGGNGDVGLYLDYNASFALPGDWPMVTAIDCLILRNQGVGKDASVRINDGWLNMYRSIISEPRDTSAVYMDDNDASTSCVLFVNFCDIYAPDQDCFSFDLDAMEHPIEIDIKNSIMVGVNGLLIGNPAFNPVSISNSVLWCSDMATSGVTEVNVHTTSEPLYLLPDSGTRNGFEYLNQDFNIGDGGAKIGSQGTASYCSFVPTWTLYE